MEKLPAYEVQDRLPLTIREDAVLYQQKLKINSTRICSCKDNHLNCLTPKEWIKAQLGVWQFYYEGRDIRDKNLHPATFPISLPQQVIKLFTHEGELVVDPFVGSGTTLIAATDLNRNAVGFDLSQKYIDLCESRLRNVSMFSDTQQTAIQDDARNIPLYLDNDSIS